MVAAPRVQEVTKKVYSFWYPSLANQTQDRTHGGHEKKGSAAFFS